MNRTIFVAASAMLLLVAPVGASNNDTTTQTFAYSLDLTNLDATSFVFGVTSDGEMFFEVGEQNGVTASDGCQTTDLANTCDGVVAVADGHSGHAPASFVFGASGVAAALTGQGVVSTTLVSSTGDDASITCTFGPPGAVVGALAYGAATCTSDTAMSAGDFSLQGAKNADAVGTITHFIVGVSGV